MNCPYCERKLEYGYIYGDRYALKWLPKSVKLKLGVFAIGGQKIGTSNFGRPRVLALKCEECQKLMIDYGDHKDKI